MTSRVFKSVKNAKHTRKNTPAPKSTANFEDYEKARPLVVSLFTGDWYGAISGYAVSGNEYLNTDGFLKKIKKSPALFDLTDPEESLFRTVINSERGTPLSIENKLRATVQVLEHWFRDGSERATTPFVVYRGIPTEVLLEKEDDERDILGTINVKNFMSTSTKRSSALVFCIPKDSINRDPTHGTGSMFKIKIPVGMPYIDTIAYSTYPDEYEIILPPGTKLIIEKLVYSRQLVQYHPAEIFVDNYDVTAEMS
jgi:hypothetical protein